MYVWKYSALENKHGHANSIKILLKLIKVHV